MHEYYTPKVPKFQAILSKSTIFVNYDHFYVNTIMLTNDTVFALSFIIFDEPPIYSGVNTKNSLNVEYE